MILITTEVNLAEQHRVYVNMIRLQPEIHCTCFAGPSYLGQINEGEEDPERDIGLPGRCIVPDIWDSLLWHKW